METDQLETIRHLRKRWKAKFIEALLCAGALLLVVVPIVALGAKWICGVLLEENILIMYGLDKIVDASIPTLTLLLFPFGILLILPVAVLSAGPWPRSSNGRSQ